MKKIDFQFKEDAFRSTLLKSARGFSLAQKRFLEFAAEWQEIPADYLSGNFSVFISDDCKRLNGEVLGKKFAIILVPFVTETENYAEGILVAENLSGDKSTEICRFLVKPNGSICSLDEEEVLPWDAPNQAYKLLIAISRRVISAKTDL